MSLLRDLISELPPEPARAIVVFAERVIEGVITKSPRPGRPEDYAGITSFAFKFCAKYEISVDLPKSSGGVYTYMESVINSIAGQRARILSNAIDTEIDQMLIQFDSGVGETFGVARLNSDEKKKIHDHIANIRQLIEEAELSQRKKNALFERLSDLEREVDVVGTRTDRFFAFAGDIAFVLGDMTKKAKPLIDEVKDILKIVGRSRARQEGVSLPPGDETLQLPSPFSEV